MLYHIQHFFNKNCFRIQRHTVDIDPKEYLDFSHPFSRQVSCRDLDSLSQLWSTLLGTSYNHLTTACMVLLVCIIKKVWTFFKQFNISNYFRFVTRPGFPHRSPYVTVVSSQYLTERASPPVVTREYTTTSHRASRLKVRGHNRYYVYV